MPQTASPSDLAVPERSASFPDFVRDAITDPSRLEVLAALDIMDTAPDTDFDRLTRVAARLFGAEFALVTLLDADRQFFKSCFGAEDVTGSPIDASFCAHAIAATHTDHMIVLDMLEDTRFIDNPFVTGWPGVRFYIGAPITVRGERLGTLCVLDTKPRTDVDPELITQLTDLAHVAATLIHLKDESRVRARTAAELMREEWRHALTLEAGKVGSWVWDVRSGDVSCNDTFRRMYGLPEAGQITIDQVMGAIDPADRDAVQAAMDQAFNQGVDYSAEMRVDNPPRWMTTHGRVYQRDADGKPLIMMGASLDITDTKQTAEQTRLLLRELNHRVKNTLAMIQSVARQTIRQNPDPHEFLDAFTGRLRTLSEAHVRLANSDWAGIRMFDVMAGQLGSDFQTQPDRVVVSGDDMLLPADHALGLGLILHELTTNAHRFGAWSDIEGVVSISWERRDTPSHGLALTWKETGGPVVNKPTEIGLGTKLIERSLAKVLDSDVKLLFEPDGVRAGIWLPLPDDY